MTEEVVREHDVSGLDDDLMRFVELNRWHSEGGWWWLLLEQDLGSLWMLCKVLSVCHVRARVHKEIAAVGRCVVEVHSDQHREWMELTGHETIVRRRDAVNVVAGLLWRVWCIERWIAQCHLDVVAAPFGHVLDAEKVLDHAAYGRAVEELGQDRRGTECRDRLFERLARRRCASDRVIDGTQGGRDHVGRYGIAHVDEAIVAHGIELRTIQRRRRELLQQ